MTKELDGTVALVTGASSGIGAATAHRLAREGAAVALVARRADRLEEVANSIRAEGGTAHVIAGDITTRAGAEATVAEAVERLGRLDILVNNAGAMLVGPFADAPEGEWERMIDVNVLGLLYVSRAALPHLMKAAEAEPRRTADLVDISSSAGRIARPGTAVYNLTKFGVNGFTERCARNSRLLAYASASSSPATSTPSSPPTPARSCAPASRHRSPRSRNCSPRTLPTPSPSPTSSPASAASPSTRSLSARRAGRAPR